MSITIQEHIPLAQFTSIRIGGPARFFLIAKSQADIEEGIRLAQEKNLKIYFLGGGCNILFPDKGIDGLVIKLQNTELQEVANGIFTAGAGVGLGFFAQETAKKGFTGAEWCSAVPGTVGGGVYGNAGAFGGEMKDIVTEIEYIDTQHERRNMKLEKLSQRECAFAYRESIFKKHPEWIIVRAKVRLRPGVVTEGQNLIKEYLAKKREGQDLGSRSAGCAFKNVKLPNDLKAIEKLRQKLEIEPDEFFTRTKNGIISAGYLIDRLGLKGKRIGGIEVSLKHANFLTNAGNATAEDVIMMTSLIKEKVRNHFGIQLQEEIQTVGF